MIIFDLDGTLSIVGDRVKYLQQELPDWDAFYEACGEDEPNEPMVRLFDMFYYDRQKLKIVTGRRESVRAKTVEWLNFHRIRIDPENLLMRPDGDTRHDTILKPELVKDFVNEIAMVFEDRNSMVKKWREMGLTCLQVAEGDF